MVLESINVKWLKRRPLLAFFIGAIYTLIGFIVAQYFFHDSLSLPMLFLTTLLITPSTIKLLSIEEKRERKEGLHHFFRNHRDVFEICVFLFLGIFFGYLLLSFLLSPVNAQMMLSYQLNFLEHQEGLSNQLLTTFFEEPPQPTTEQFLNLLGIDIKVALVFFVLSFFYGAGAIFLIILNASIFATFTGYLITHLSTGTTHVFLILGIFFIHVLPEISGFLLAAIAGGVVSKALIQEKFLSQKFKNVVKDAALLLALSCVLIFLAVYLETFVTTTLFYNAFR